MTAVTAIALITIQRRCSARTVGVCPLACAGMRDLAVDRLPRSGPSLEVVVIEDATFGADAGGPRAPHRHDYHELIWTRAGEGRHLIDGEPSPVTPGTLTVIGRGQV